MTREEAARIINECKNEGFKYTLYTKEEYHMALDMAIKALEQQPCEYTISRQAVLEQINCWIGSGEYKYTNATEYLTKRIKGITQKEGHWIPVEYPTGVEAFGVKEMIAVALRCSVCGKEIDISDGDFRLCPYCGAKMEVQE